MFDELLAHLQKFKSFSVVSVSEDAAIIISHVEYDFHSNKCVESLQTKLQAAGSRVYRQQSLQSAAI